MSRALVFSCEHGGHRVPAAHRALLRPATRALPTHRGWDAGALTLARELAAAHDAPLFACTTTRLLVDANRSARHPRLFSEWSRKLSPADRARVLARWWLPHRAAVEEFARSHGEVLHLSIHSFTPVWEGRAREVDIGFLYDPGRPRERAFAHAWQRAMRRRMPDLRCRANQPYRGTSDGLVTHLRRTLPERRYLGLELEVSQRFPLGDAATWRRLRGVVRASLLDALR